MFAALESAMAADPIPDSLSLGGVTIYGTVDVGYAYQSHGVPVSATLPGGLEYQAFTTTRNFAGSQTTMMESGLEQSKVGIRVAEPVVNEGAAFTGAFRPQPPGVRIAIPADLK